MRSTKPPEQNTDPVVGKLFGIITSRLESAHEASMDGHRPEQRLEQVQVALDGVQVELADIGILIEAIELLVSENSS